MNRVVLLLALTACIRDHYECHVDTDCNLGVAGRCELDHRCTSFDASCESGRRYTAHSSSETNVCFDDHITLTNPCAPGQPPPHADGCAATVCAALPACCTSAWTDACVQEAERSCTITCDTRIAVTATRNARTELWDLSYNGHAWSAAQRTDRTTLLSYLAPAPGTTAPRLAGFALPDLVVEGGPSELDLPLSTDHHYQDLASLDVERDGHDTAVLAWQDAGGAMSQEILKLDSGETREVAASVDAHEAWGDYDHDAFPDGIGAAGARYTLLVNIDGQDHRRTLDDSVSSGFTGLGTSGQPSARSFDWNDLDHDGLLDLVAFGNSLRIHLGGDRLNDVPLATVDCDPPQSPPGTCDATTATFAGAVLPGDPPSIIAALQPRRALYRLHVSEGPPASVAVSEIALSGDACGSACPPILSVVARDLDGDHLVDLVAIDAALNLFVGLTTVDPGLATLIEVKPATGSVGGFNAMRTSVSGSPR